MDKIQLIKFIKKKLKEHRNLEDPDGFAICPVTDVHQRRVAPKGEWLGTEEGRKKAIKDLKFEQKTTRCEFCDFCSELLVKINGEKK